jgi:hypothetical protein
LKLTAQYPSKLFSNFLIFDESVGNNIWVDAFPWLVLSFSEEVGHEVVELLRGMSGEVLVERNQEVNVQVAKIVLPQLLHELTYPWLPTGILFCTIT